MHIKIAHVIVSHGEGIQDHFVSPYSLDINTQYIYSNIDITIRLARLTHVKCPHYYDALASNNNNLSTK